ncbi:uncharacterized protein AB675_7449 [Cyphellophora attinorum]|uniref:Uncharacterized protein n=1 Tax=Cyphellophora attinorum TaxID=1664694 RepID=A0A0N1H4T8_9EURO|nr:uncharacterized protein AB675_7449 [Phialophora attinorum]KPI40413.1 hypothetical protein AB675_7449 [Phialophora attinorum]
MPDPQEYQFVPASHGHSRAPRELQRIVRSQAATVSRREASARQPPRLARLSRGEEVVHFDTRPAADPRTRQPEPRLPDPTVDSSSGLSFLPISRLPLYHQAYLPCLIDHYVTNLTVPTPEIDGSSTLPLFRAAWMPIVLSDPVIFQVVVLFTATHFATIADPRQFDTARRELLLLKQSALSVLIQKVQSEQNTPSDVLIAAAAKMASYEAIFGSPGAFHLHMSTVVRLLRLRGAATLGMDGFLVRLLSFIDTNSAFLLGTNMYLTEFGLTELMPRTRPFHPLAEGGLVPDNSREVSGREIVNLERFVGFMNRPRQEWRP